MGISSAHRRIRTRRIPAHSHAQPQHGRRLRLVGPHGLPTGWPTAAVLQRKWEKVKEMPIWEIRYLCICATILVILVAAGVINSWT
jgi:hypothetical protein